MRGLEFNGEVCTTMAKIIAKTIDGKEFVYSRKSAHAVSAAGAEAICKTLNDNKYQLKEGEKWHVYDVGAWELEYMGAAYQSFTRRKGYVYEKRGAYSL